MVDALLKIKTLLKPNGLLIDLHPQDIPLPVYVQLEASIHQVGIINVEDKFNKYRRADAALETVLKQGIYAVQEKTAVDFFVYFDTVAQCRQYISEEWSNAQLPDESWQKMSALMATPAAFKQIYNAEGVNFCSLVLPPKLPSPQPV